MLEECLASVLACAPAPAEVVVVDQSSDDATRHLVCRHQGGAVPVRYLRGRGTGLARARNQGIADCTAPVVAFTDDDCRVEPGWIGALTDAIRSGAADAAAGRTLPDLPEGGGAATFSRYAPERPPVFSRRTHPWRVGGGGNFAARTQALVDAGLFDERFGPGAELESAEDMELVQRLLRSGFRIVYAGKAVVRHRSWRSDGEHRSLSRSYGVGAGACFAKHLLSGDLLSGWRFAARAGVRATEMAGAALRGDRRRARESAAYLRGLFAGAGRYLRAGSPAGSPAGRVEEERV